MDWSGRVAIVTGGASGIGAATVREFAREGAAAVLFDINTQAGEEVASDLKKEGLNAAFVRLDVADADACREAVKSVFAQHGRLDYLVNSAVSFLGKGLDATTEDWERSLGVNVRGGANMAQSCHGPMKQTGGGAIVNISSISGHIAQP